MNPIIVAQMACAGSMALPYGHHGRTCSGDWETSTVQLYKMEIIIKKLYVAFFSSKYYIELALGNLDARCQVLSPIPVKESILQTSFSRLKIISAAALLLAASAAQADISVFTSQSAYLAAVSNTGVDTFDDLPIDALGGPLNRNAGSYTYTVSSEGASPILYGAGTGSDNWLSTNNRNDSVVFSNFSSAVRGVGGFFFGSNFAGEYASSQSITLTARNALGELLTYELALPTQASFVGFLSTGAFSDLAVSTAGQIGIWPTINNLSVSAVPEPATYGMLLGGLGLLGFMTRRRKARQQ